MSKIPLKSVSKFILVILIVFFSNNILAQQPSDNYRSQSEFWKKVQFGGGLGLGFGTGYTDISISPSAIYNVNEFVALGLGVQYGYINQKNFYDSHLYGGSLIGLFNPIREIQLSVELEELRVNLNYDDPSIASEDFWNTALFLGAGYRTGNVTIGARYNVLFNDNKNVYSDAFMPFVRVFF